MCYSVEIYCLNNFLLLLKRTGWLFPAHGALSDDAVWRLAVAYIGPKSRTERPRKTKIGTEVAHVTRDSDTFFEVNGQGHQAALVGGTGRPTWTSS